VSEGSRLQLFCEASGKPQPNITWVRVLHGGNVSEVLHWEPTWNFVNINRTMAGTYRCIANNGLGNPASQFIKVTVHCK